MCLVTSFLITKTNNFMTLVQYPILFLWTRAWRMVFFINRRDAEENNDLLMISKFILCRNFLAATVCQSEMSKVLSQTGSRLGIKAAWFVLHCTSIVLKEIFEIKTHQKLSSFLYISRKDLNKLPSLSSRYEIPNYQSEIF